jgi:hypothetical protein
MTGTGALRVTSSEEAFRALDAIPPLEAGMRESMAVVLMLEAIHGEDAAAELGVHQEADRAVRLADRAIGRLRHAIDRYLCSLVGQDPR